MKSKEERGNLLSYAKKLFRPVSIYTLGLLAAVFISYNAWMSHKDLERATINHSLSMNQGLAKSLGETALDQFIEEHVEQLQIVARNKHFRERIFRDEPTYGILKTLYDINKNDVTTLYAINSKGIVVNRQPKKPGSIGTDYAQKPGFKFVSNI